jgi:hypothetical protein
MAISALQELDGVGIRELLDQDSRPTFVIDLDPDLSIALNTGALAPVFCNAALRTYERLQDVVRGSGEDEPDSSTDAYKKFRSWATSRTQFDESGDVFPSTHVFFGMLWTGSTVRKRWRLMSGNHCYQLTSAASGDLSSGSPSEVAGSNMLEKVGVHHAQASSTKGTVAPLLPASSQLDSTVVSSFKPQTTKCSERQESSYSSIGGKSTASLNLDATHSTTDWTVAEPKGELSAHIEFARSIDWAQTSLGAMSTWSAELRQLTNLLMKNPHPAAIFWGDELTAIYNEGYRDTVSGNKHPGLMGAGFREPFAEIWDAVSPLFAQCARTGNSIAMENQLLPLERRGFLEETYFTWSFIPLYGSGSKILGFFNVPFETTKEQINARQTQTLRRLGEEVGPARSISSFWKKVLIGLEENKYDVPVAILYSVIDVDDGEVSSNSGSSISLKSCILEGSLGIPEGHIAAPARLDLKRSTEGVS